jgi:capsule polysaccharide export protein KpsE/RkpR
LASEVERGGSGLTAKEGSGLVEQGSGVTPDTAIVELFPEPAGVLPSGRMTEAILTIWQSRRRVCTAGLVSFLVAALVAFLTPPKYESTTRLMPPDSSSTSALALSLLTGRAGEGLSSVAADLGGFKTTGALFVGVLRSRTLEDRLINSFDLRAVYRAKLMRDARDKLEENTDIAEDRKSGIISVTVTDRSPERARALADAYVSELNRLNAELSTTAAHREREFLEQRLQTVKAQLDQASRDFSEFSSRTTTLDIGEQGKAMVTAAASLQGELIASQAQLGSLRQIYTDNNFRVRALQGRIETLDRQLKKLRGGAPGSATSPSDESGGDFPTIRQLPVLGVRYLDLFRRVKIHEAVYETLTKQYELAKVAEAKETPVVKILDPGNLPEKKSSPHRILIMLTGLVLGFAISSVSIVGVSRVQQIESVRGPNLIRVEVKRGAAEDYEKFRQILKGVTPFQHENPKPNGDTET